MNLSACLKPAIFLSLLLMVFAAGIASPAAPLRDLTVAVSTPAPTQRPFSAINERIRSAVIKTWPKTLTCKAPLPEEFDQQQKVVRIHFKRGQRPDAGSCAWSDSAMAATDPDCATQSGISDIFVSLAGTGTGQVAIFSNSNPWLMNIWYSSGQTASFSVHDGSGTPHCLVIDKVL